MPIPFDIRLLGEELLLEAKKEALGIADSNCIPGNRCVGNFAASRWWIAVSRQRPHPHRPNMVLLKFEIRAAAVYDGTCIAQPSPTVGGGVA